MHGTFHDNNFTLQQPNTWKKKRKKVKENLKQEKGEKDLASDDLLLLVQLYKAPFTLE